MLQTKKIFNLISQEITTNTILFNKKIVITAGLIREYLDTVRYLSSPISGLTAYEIAKVICKYWC